MSATWLLTSKLSPFSSSLISSPPKLPPLPTLSELQRYAEDAKTSLIESSPAIFGTPPGQTQADPSGPNLTVKKPARAIAISKSVRQPVKPWGPPAVYSLRDPRQDLSEVPMDIQVENDRTGGKNVSKKLKKGRGGKEGYKRVQSGLPGEEAVMKPSRRYVLQLGTGQDQQEELDRGVESRAWYTW